MKISTLSIALVAALALNGCSTTRFKEYIPPTKDIRFSQTPVQAYNDAVDCATRIIFSPQGTPLFIRKSNSLKQFVANVHYQVHSEHLNTKGKAKLNAIVQSTTLHLEVSEPKVFVHMGNGVWYPAVTDITVDQSAKEANQLLDSFEVCFNKHQS